MLALVLYPDPVLNRKAEPVALDLPDLPELIECLLATMREAHGVGLAAPQVGRSLRLFVAAESGDSDEALVCINPKIQPFGEAVELEEGCLSIPDLRADVLRPEQVRMTWTGPDGKECQGEFDGLLARIIQHEFDHLEGTLFIERLTETDRLRVRPDLKALEEQFQPR